MNWEALQLADPADPVAPTPPQVIQQDFTDLAVASPLSFLSGGLLATDSTDGSGLPGTMVRVLSIPRTPTVDPATYYHPYPGGPGNTAFYDSGATVVFNDVPPGLLYWEFILEPGATDHLPVGAYLYFTNLTAKTCTLYPGSGVTLIKPGSLAPQSSVTFSQVAGTIRAHKYDVDCWHVSGDVA